MRQITKKKLRANDDCSRLEMTSEENDTYTYEDVTYTIESDTMHLKGIKISHRDEIPFDGKISLNNFKEFSVKKFDVLKTSLLILGCAAIAALILLFIALHNLFGDGLFSQHK